jgi:hypothetical protein
MVLTTISAVLFVVVFLADLLGVHTNPYIGILFFLVLPAVFIVGLILIPLGAWIERRRRAAGKAPTTVQWPRIDLNDPTQRRTAVIVFALTMANIVIVSLAAYRGVEYMDSVGFCGQVCHTAMGPEFVAHQAGSHAGVRCVNCHVGSGATSFIKSKLSGSRRAVAVAFGNYSRPTTAEPDELIGAAETCEQCHSAGRFHGDKVRKISEYADDEKNSESVTTLTLHLGGGGPRAGSAAGIHWHANPANAIEYVATDSARQEIPYVRVSDGRGGVREYAIEGANLQDLAQRPRRRMDCTDCHNRPSHTIATTPERAVNAVMANGVIDKTLPFVRREAVKALKASHPTQESGIQEVGRALRDFYGTLPAGGADRGPRVDRAVAVVEEIYRRNVFPEMKVSFGTYPSNIGHFDSPGCFRCHDDNHKSKDGPTIGQDCETCHSIQ